MGIIEDKCSSIRRVADSKIPVAGLPRVQSHHPSAVRSLATPATVGIFVTAPRFTAADLRLRRHELEKVSYGLADPGTKIVPTLEPTIGDLPKCRSIARLVWQDWLSR